MRFRIYWMVILVCTAGTAMAGDSIIVKKDPRLDILASKQALNNTRNAVAAGRFKGFRVQVMSTTSRNTAFDTKGILDANFPDQKSYVTYQSPSFRVRIGNFLKREDADNFRKQLARIFPEGAYIVEDTIEYTPPEDEEIISQ